MIITPNVGVINKRYLFVMPFKCILNPIFHENYQIVTIILITETFIKVYQRKRIMKKFAFTYGLIFGNRLTKIY